MPYQIHRYPAELIEVIGLTHGQRVVVRPVLPQDRELMVAFFHGLSADARCNRFMHPVSEPSSELLRQFTQVDYTSHVALVGSPDLTKIGRDSLGAGCRRDSERFRSAPRTCGCFRGIESLR